MIEQLRRVVRENPSLEPFVSGTVTTTTNQSRFDAVAYAREAFSRSRTNAGAGTDGGSTASVLDEVAALA